MPTWEQQREGERAKIDSEAVDGLAGVSNSLAYKVHEIERHAHHHNHFFGAAASPSGETHVADHLTMTSFQADAGSSAFGSWLQILGSSDTPHVSGSAFYDLNLLFVETVERTAANYLVQIGFGATGAAAISADDVTETMFKVDTAAARSVPVEISTERHAAGTKAWIRIWADGQATGTMDFFISLHEYEG